MTCATTLPSLRFINIVLLLATSIVAAFAAGNFNQNVDVTWGDGRGKILNNGQLLSLSLDKSSGSGFRSKNEYLFGKIDMQLKLVPGNSAGTVTTYYLSSEGPTHDEIDLEFLGNVTGEPYTLHTNVFSQGKGGREQQFRLWFDPTASFHTYSILWNPQSIIFSVDRTPIRVFKNMQSIGVTYPHSQPMRVYASLWDAEDWATQGGRIKTDWSKAPFTASFRNFNADACVMTNGQSSCRGSTSAAAWMNQQLDVTSQKKPNSQPMRVYSSLWDAEDWATQGGRVKTDWSKAPFTASFRNFNADACILTNGQSSCSGSTTAAVWMNQQLDTTSQKRLQWAQKNYMIYNYCTDYQRFPQGLPKECKF